MSSPPPLKLLPTLPAEIPSRPTQSNIPATAAERERLRELVRGYVAENDLVPPVPIDALRERTLELLKKTGIDQNFVDFTGVLLNNELWRETLATIPFERRLLLLPKCLRLESHCPAPFDEFGLLCKKCGMCSIQDLQSEAERLGYAVLVAEGSPIVMSIIETGKIDAIVGVSCLSVLERAFPYMEAAAIPGVAIPLLQDDCVDTNVDLEWIWDVIQLTADDRTRRLDLAALRDEVREWFTRESLDRLLGKPTGETEEIARAWLARSGKRWRPILTVAMQQALAAEPDAELADDLRRVAIAVECFHKASLVHDDIEDDDAVRYGEETLHAELGVPVALNVGDLLIGEGYRILAECEAAPETRAAMLRVAAEGHRTLCRGQGAELCWARRPAPLAPIDVVNIFREKTAPAFEVALQIGLLYGGGDDATAKVVTDFSRSLGIAYQIRDDLDDLAETAEAGDLEALRPTLPLAVAREKAKGVDRELFDALWRREAAVPADTVRRRMEELGAVARCRELFDAYKEEAIRSLWPLGNASVKGLLRRVIGKMFGDAEIKGWCREHETRNAAGRETGAAASA